MHGFGLNLVLLKETEMPIGMCGLLTREELDYPDLGYAFLPDFWSKGYASEAADSVLKEGVSAHSLHTILAITLPCNLRSSGLLKKIGFCFKETTELNGSQNDVYKYSV